MISPQWLELPISRTIFHGPEDVRVIVVRLYKHHLGTVSTNNYWTTNTNHYKTAIKRIRGLISGILKPDQNQTISRATMDPTKDNNGQAPTFRNRSWKELSVSMWPSCITFILYVTNLYATTDNRFQLFRKSHFNHQSFWIYRLSCHKKDLLVNRFSKKVKKKSRECHNHKPQPLPDTKRKRKQTKPNKRKLNKRTKSTKTTPPHTPTAPPPPPPHTHTHITTTTTEAIATPKGPKNTRTKQHKARHKTNRLAEQTTKQQRARPTPGPPPQNSQQDKLLVGWGWGGGTLDLLIYS